MLSVFLKENYISFTHFHSIDDLIKDALQNPEFSFTEPIQRNLWVLFQERIKIFPATIDNQNTLLHLFNPQITKTMLGIFINSESLSVSEKDKEHFNILYLLFTQSLHLKRYAKLKGRLIRVLEDEPTNELLRQTKKKGMVLQAILNMEEKIMQVPYGELPTTI